VRRCRGNRLLCRVSRSSFGSSLLEYPGVPGSTPEYPRVPPSTPEYPRVSRLSFGSDCVVASTKPCRRLVPAPVRACARCTELSTALVVSGGRGAASLAAHQRRAVCRSGLSRLFPSSSTPIAPVPSRYNTNVATPGLQRAIMLQRARRPRLLPPFAHRWLGPTRPLPPVGGARPHRPAAMPSQSALVDLVDAADPLAAREATAYAAAAATCSMRSYNIQPDSDTWRSRGAQALVVRNRSSDRRH
jgi:hypothetical protein